MTSGTTRAANLPPSSSGQYPSLRRRGNSVPPNRPSRRYPGGRSAMGARYATAVTHPFSGARNAVSSVPTRHPCVASRAAVVDFPAWPSPASSQPRPAGSTAVAAWMWCQPVRRSRKISTVTRNVSVHSSSRAAADGDRVTHACGCVACTSATAGAASQVRWTPPSDGSARTTTPGCRNTGRGSSVRVGGCSSRTSIHTGIGGSSCARSSQARSTARTWGSLHRR